MKVLLIDSCISTHQSRTRRLADAYINELKNAFSKSEFVDGKKGDDLTFGSEELEVKEILCREGAYRCHTSEFLQRRDELIAQGKFDNLIFDQAKEFRDADLIVIAAPYWDLSFPAALKVYIEGVMVPGLTFDSSPEGFVGLCKAKKLVYITTAGGYIKNLNLGYDYMKAIGKMVGINDSQCIYAEGLDIVENDEKEIMDGVLRNLSRF